MSDRLKQIKDFMAEDPSDPFLIFALAKEYEKLDSINEAHETYVTLYNEHPTYIGLYLHYGRILEKLGKTSEALKIYNEGVVVAKSTGDFHSASELNTARTNLEIEL